MKWLNSVEAQRTDVQTTLERMTCFSLLVEFVAIPPSHLRVRTKPSGFEFAGEPLRSALGDAGLGRDIGDPHLRPLRPTARHISTRP